MLWPNQYLPELSTIQLSLLFTFAVCPAGTFSHAGSDTCIPCRAGTFSRTNGSDGCILAATGYYAPGGTTTDVICPAGSYSDYPGASSCTPCGGGYLGTQAGSRSKDDCQYCPIGTYCSASEHGGVCASCSQCPGPYPLTISGLGDCPIRGKGAAAAIATLNLNCIPDPKP